MIHAFRSAPRAGHVRAAVLCATALCIGCTTKAVLQPVRLEGYQAAPDTLAVTQKDTSVFNGLSDRFEVKTSKYTYVGEVDYPRIAQQAARSFRNYVRCGADSSRKLFLTSLDMLVDGKNYLKQQTNLGYLSRDPVYSAIREEFRKAKPDEDADAFLDAIRDVRESGNSSWIRLLYGNGFVNAVLKYSR